MASVKGAICAMRIGRVLIDYHANSEWPILQQQEAGKNVPSQRIASSNIVSRLRIGWTRKETDRRLRRWLTGDPSGRPLLNTGRIAFDRSLEGTRWTIPALTLSARYDSSCARSCGVRSPTA